MAGATYVVSDGAGCATGCAAATGWYATGATGCAAAAGWTAATGWYATGAAGGAGKCATGATGGAGAGWTAATGWYATGATGCAAATGGAGWCATGATGAAATGATGAIGCAGAACLGLGIGAIAFLTLGEEEDSERGGPFGLGLIEGPAGGPERGGPPIPEGPEGPERGGPTDACGGPAFGGADGAPPKGGREVGEGLLGACLCG